MTEQIKILINGLGGALDIAPSHLSLELVDLPDNRSDKDKIASDWRNVGNDLKQSLKKYQSSHEQKY